ncbi:MAG: Fic family protein [Breznakibacter sp.]
MHIDTALILKQKVDSGEIKDHNQASGLLDKSDVLKDLLTDFDFDILNLFNRLTEISEIPFAFRMERVQKWIRKLADLSFCGDGFSITGKSDDILSCYNSMITSALIRMDYFDKVRINNGINWILDYQNVERGAENKWTGSRILKYGGCMKAFVTIHPFEDGNGRITRALTDMLLAQSDKSNQRFYSMSAQIRIERKEYYEILEKTQKGNLDITEWIKWFLNCLINALKSTDSVLARVLFKADFWAKHSKTLINERQRKLLNRLLDGFDGKLTSSKWAKIVKCSRDTAIRDINDLIDKNILQKEAAGGRSTNYELKG